MSRSPRNTREPLFSKKNLLISILQWCISLLSVLMIYNIFLRLWQSEIVAKTAMFITLITGNIFLILVNRSWTQGIRHILKTKNTAFLPVTWWALMILFLIVYIPALQHIFKFASMPIPYFLLAIIGWIIGILWFEIAKHIAKHKHIELLKI
jgi:Ca2+-transporting ATPase